MTPSPGQITVSRSFFGVSAANRSCPSSRVSRPTPITRTPSYFASATASLEADEPSTADLREIHALPVELRHRRVAGDFDVLRRSLGHGEQCGSVLPLLCLTLEERQ